MAKRLPTNSQEAIEDKFQQSVVDQHKMAIRTADELRKVVLLPTKDERQTELDDFLKGVVDPQLQLVLIARDNFLSCENPVARLGYYKAMKEVFQDVKSDTMKVLDMIQKERHHREKLSLMEKKLNNSDPTDDEVEAAIEAKG